MQGTSGEEALSQIRKGFGVSFPVVLFAMFKDIIEVQQSQNQLNMFPAFPVACAEGPVLALLGKF